MEIFHGIQYDYSSLEYKIYSRNKFIGKRKTEEEALKLFNANLFTTEQPLKEYKEKYSVFFPRGVKSIKKKNTLRSLTALKKELSKGRLKEEKKGRKRKSKLKIIDVVFSDDEEMENIDEEEHEEEDEEESCSSLFGSSSGDEETEDEETKNVEVLDTTNEIENSFIKKKKKMLIKKKNNKNITFIPEKDIEGIEYF